jgi:hypothetical protein
VRPYGGGSTEGDVLRITSEGRGQLLNELVDVGGVAITYGPVAVRLIGTITALDGIVDGLGTPGAELLAEHQFQPGPGGIDGANLDVDPPHRQGDLPDDVVGHVRG